MSTVNISFNPKLLKEIDKVAQEESRSRSELIREAARSYIERKRRWGKIFDAGTRLGRARGITPEIVEQEIAAYRREKRKQ
jgi:metal-responsive CopG/Arc/MetJ family transcriptional regulator